MNVIDAYIADIKRKVLLNIQIDDLSMRGTEVYKEVTDSISKEDNVQLDKYLQAIISVYKINSSSTFLYDLQNKMPDWHVQALSKKQYGTYSTLLSAWREIRVLSVTSGKSNDAFNFSQVAAIVVSKTVDADEAAFTYALHLKELVMYSWLPGKSGAIFTASYQQVAYYLRDIVNLINELLYQKEIKFRALQKVMNQVQQIVSYLETETRDEYDSKNSFGESREAFLSRQREQ